jgi:hypothetical protein
VWQADTRLSPFVRPTLVNGTPGLVTALGGRPLSVMGFAIRGGKITEIDILADPERLARLDLGILGDGRRPRRAAACATGYLPWPHSVITVRHRPGTARMERGLAVAVTSERHLRRCRW